MGCTGMARHTLGPAQQGYMYCVKKSFASAAPHRSVARRSQLRLARAPPGLLPLLAAGLPLAASPLPSAARRRVAGALRLRPGTLRLRLSTPSRLALAGPAPATRLPVAGCRPAGRRPTAPLRTCCSPQLVRNRSPLLSPFGPLFL